MRVRHALIGASGAAAVTLIAGALMVAPSASAQQTASGLTASNTTANCAQTTAPHMMHCFSVRRTDIAGVQSLKPNATPSGIGPLAPGDQVTIKVAGVGDLTNSVEQRTTAQGGRA